MTIYERIEIAKKTHSLNNRLLGEVVGASEMGFGQMMRRQKLSKLKIKALDEYLDSLEEKETKNPQQSEGFSFSLKEHYDKMLSQKDAFLELVLKDNERLRKKLEDSDNRK